MAFQIRLPCVFHGGLEGDDQHTFTKTPVNNTKGPVNAVQKACYFLIILLLNGITIMAFQTSSPEETPPAHDGPSKKPVFSCFNRQRCCYHRASCHARPNTTAIHSARSGSSENFSHICALLAYIFAFEFETGLLRNHPSHPTRPRSLRTPRSQSGSNWRKIRDLYFCY